MMRKIATILCGLALFASVAATIYLLITPQYQFEETVVTESGYDTIQGMKTLVEVNGTWVAYLLVGVTLASSVPLFVALTRTSSQRLVTWVFALLLMAFSIVGGLSIGLLFMPSAILLLTAAIVTLFIRKDTAI
jgi:hypothetical protein